MKTWKSTSLLYLLVPLLGALTYVSAVVIFEGGRELVETMWKGYFIQIFLLSSYGIILGLFSLLPVLLTIEKVVKNQSKIILSYVLATILFLTVTFTLYSGASPLTSLIISLAPAVIILIIKNQIINKASDNVL